MKIELNKDGFLNDHTTWNIDVANFLAEKQNIILTDEHWEIINILREFYLQYNTSPSIRALVNLVRDKYGVDKGNSLYLLKLFPGGPALQANNIAGLPKPIRCI